MVKVELHLLVKLKLVLVFLATVSSYLMKSKLTMLKLLHLMLLLTQHGKKHLRHGLMLTQHLQLN